MRGGKRRGGGIRVEKKLPGVLPLSGQLREKDGKKKRRGKKVEWHAIGPS